MWRLIAISSKPCRCKLARIYSSIGRPWSGKSALGVCRVRSPNRVPRPAHNTIALISLSKSIQQQPGDRDKRNLAELNLRAVRSSRWEVQHVFRFEPEPSGTQLALPQ